MNPLILNVSDIEGGAARAAYRLHTGLKQIGVNSRMLVGLKRSDDASVIGPVSKWGKGMGIIGPTLDGLPLQLYRERESTTFYPAFLPEGVVKKVKSIKSDIIHLHWVCGGFLRIESLQRFQKPIIWTLHDMWAFTGGCHYAGACEGYKRHCGQCPQLGSNSKYDISWWTWRRKAKSWDGLNLTVVAPSTWMKNCVQESSLMKNACVEIIPNGLDTSRYRPMNRTLARSLLGLSEDKNLILFGAMKATIDQRKGFQFLLPSLKGLVRSGMSRQAELVVFGSSKPANPPEFGFRTHYMGRFHDDISISLIYAACDVFVAPSTEDNLSNTVMESLACGTPCVAFNIGGMPDMIEHEKNGYLAQPFDTVDLSDGIAWVLADRERWKVLSRGARQKVEREFDIRTVAKKYVELYKDRMF